MPARRIIPCLDVKDGRVVKGVQFRDHRDVGDIVEHALQYSEDGADELVFYDISASADRRSLDPEWVRRVATSRRTSFVMSSTVRLGSAAAIETGISTLVTRRPPPAEA